MTVTIAPQPMTDGPEKIRVKAPYHPRFPERAHTIGGSFNRDHGVWYFDARDTEAVRALVQDIYGVDPMAGPVETVTIRVTLTNENRGERKVIARGEELWLFGRQLLRRQYRSNPVILGEGVILISGGFPAYGGSNRNPDIDVQDGTVIEVRDVPRSLVEKDTHGGIEIMEEAPVAKPGTALEQILDLAKLLTPEQREFVRTHI